MNKSRELIILTLDEAGYDVRGMKKNILLALKKLGIAFSHTITNTKGWGDMEFIITNTNPKSKYHNKSVKVMLYKNDPAPSPEDIEHQLRSDKNYLGPFIKLIDKDRAARAKEDEKEKKNLEKEKIKADKDKAAQLLKDKATVKKHGDVKFTPELASKLTNSMHELSQDLHTLDPAPRGDHAIASALAELSMDRVESPELDGLFDKYGYDLVYKAVYKLAKGLI